MKVDRPNSVLHGRDCEAIRILLAVHCDQRKPRILDCTHNMGTMWKGTGIRPTVTMDRCPDFNVDVIADFRQMPFPGASFDVLVFDPPHLPASAGTGSRMHQPYNVGARGDGRDFGLNVSAIFPPFLTEAKRVLRPSGILLAKIADTVNARCQQWQQVDFVNAARAAGLTPCDMLIKIDPSAGALADPDWKNVFHFRKCHCYWIVVRNSRSCERRRRR